MATTVQENRATIIPARRPQPPVVVSRRRQVRVSIAGRAAAGPGAGAVVGVGVVVGVIAALIPVCGRGL
jgi:hypothetical protein